MEEHGEFSFLAFAFLVLGLTACSVNGLLIWVIVRNRNFITTSNVVIVSLAVSDFALGLVVAPMEMIHHLHLDFEFVGYGCLAHHAVMIFIPLVSVVHLLLVSIERFFMIGFPLYYHSLATRPRIAALLVVAWVFPLLLSVIPFAGLHQNMERVNGTECGFLDMLPCQYLFPVIGMITLICLIMVSLYSYIMKISFRHAEQLRQLTVPRPKSRFAKAKELKALCVLAITVLSFMFSYMPFAIDVIDKCIKKDTSPYYSPAVLIAYFNSTVNPIIYGVGNRDLRNSFLQLCCRRKRVIAPNDTMLAVISAAQAEPN